MDEDLRFVLDHEGSWLESHRITHHNCCMKTLDDAWMLIMALQVFDKYSLDYLRKLVNNLLNSLMIF
jgi:hypothetical protein